MLKCKGISKNYGNTQALDNFSYEFNEGIIGLLGPNRAGKSTLINILTGNVSVNSGVCTFEGIDIHKMPKEYRSNLAYLPQYLDGYPNFTVREYMYYIGSLKMMDKENIKEQTKFFLERLQLYDVIDMQIKTLSGGMKKRLLICSTLLNYPKVVILDEPTAGLDPMQRILVRNLLSELKKDRIIIIATHVVSDVEYIADELIFLKEGQIIKSGTPKSLIDESKAYIRYIEIDEEDLEDYLKTHKISSITRIGDKLKLKIIDTFKTNEDIPTFLDDVYLHIMD